MKHTMKYLHGLAISIVSIQFVFASCVCIIATLALVHAAYAFALVTTFLYECRLAPKAKKGDDIQNPIAKFSEKVVNLSFKKV